MANLFRNNYKVYLYKYNYKALQNKIQDLLNGNSVNKFLFESFVTNLYTLGIPSEDVIKEISSKYKQYVNEFKTYKPNISNKNKKTIQNIGDSKTVEYKSINDKPDNYIIHERATTSLDDTFLQEALAQNYALQKLQRDYEDTMMAPSSAKTNWMATMESRQTYDNYITNALDASKKLLDELFKPVIDDLDSIQSSGIVKSDYVYVIDLTDLATTAVLDKVQTTRTKYSSKDFMDTSIDGVLSDDSNTNAVDSIGIITTTLESLSNVTSFNLRQNILLKHGITIEANDIIEIVDTNINTVLDKSYSELNYSESKLRNRTQFIGFVTKVSLSQRFGETSLLNVTCEGISKMLSLNPTINSNAVAPQFKSVADFISGTDKTQATSDANVVNVFSTFFDGLSAYDLFVKLLSDVLGVTPVKEDKEAYSMRLISDPDKLRKLPYQYSKPLLILYHFAVTCSTLREVKSQVLTSQPHIILARLDNNVNQEKLQAYLLMIRSQYDLFWSNMNTPINILQTLANNTFLEVFEDRTGILILRPPRYNTWIEGDIIEADNFIEWIQSVDDSALKSRSDYQWSIPLLGVQNEFCGGYYQDIPAMLKYGFRADAPKSSPSVQSEIDAAVYSALDVTKANSNTRTFELTVPLVQDYKLGHLYYFPEKNSNVFRLSQNKLDSKGFVGYLTTITTTVAPGNVDTHRLIFKYMRAAECFEGSMGEGLAGGLVTILNFKRLPELSMYQSSVTEDMLTKSQQDNLLEKVRRLVSSSRYYWASYYTPNKIKFDEGVARGITISKSEYKELYRTMAPTNIRVGDFKSLNNINSSYFVPSQQLINAIWCADILSRTGYLNKSNIAYADNAAMIKLYTRQLRTKRNEKELIKFLQKDKTIHNIGAVNYLDVSNSNLLSAPYATVNLNIREGNSIVPTEVFLITDSLIPNIKTAFGSEESDIMTTYMRNVVRAYRLYNSNDSFYEWYENKYKIKERKVISNKLTDVNNCINAFSEAENNIYKYPYFLNQYNQSKEFMDRMLIYYDLKNKSVVDKISDAFLELKEAAMKSLTSMGVLTLNNIQELFETIKNVFTKVEVGVPAYLVNTETQLPAVHSLKSTGTYVAGVCPIDYNDYIVDQLNSKVRDALKTGDIILRNLNILTANGLSIGTITKLVFDDNLSDNTNLYFYPVIELNKDPELTKAYAGMQNLTEIISNTYMLTEEEINSFIQNNESTKKVACVIRVTPTGIPETKIPTIQQVYNQDGLYVGYNNQGTEREDVNPRKAIFDPGVLYEWTNADIEDLYTVNIYNFVECCDGNKFGKFLSCNKKTSNSGRELDIQVLQKIPWDIMIQSNNVCKVPCVSNTRLSIKKLAIPWNETASDKIRYFFKSLSVQKTYEINDEPSVTGFMYIKDLPTSDRQLALTFDVEHDGKSGNIRDEVSSSYTTNIDAAVISDFLNSVVDKEETQVGLYNWGPYMPYSTKDFYPNYVNLALSNFGGTVTIGPEKKLKLTVKRELCEKTRTIGKLYINGEYFCDTLEDTYRGQLENPDDKVPKETAIPNGVYNITVSRSNSKAFKGRYLPLIYNNQKDYAIYNIPTNPNGESVIIFTGIRIHTGWTEVNTEGCILLGTYKNGVWIPSNENVDYLVSEIQRTLNATISVEGGVVHV